MRLNFNRYELSERFESVGWSRYLDHQTGAVISWYGSGLTIITNLKASTFNIWSRAIIGEVKKTEAPEIGYLIDKIGAFLCCLLNISSLNPRKYGNYSQFW